jgi:hypothetical protein
MLCGMNSTYKYYGTAFVIFEFHSFDLQASVADDLQVMHFVSEAWVSLLQGASGSCRRGLHYFIDIQDGSFYTSFYQKRYLIE